MSLLSISLVLFLIMDPVGNISSFHSMAKAIDPERQRWVLLRELLIALMLMVTFNFIGEGIFYIFEISDVAVKLSSGMILFLVSLQILFPTLNSIRQNIAQEEPFISPLAIPLIAGPSLLATIMLYAHIETSIFIMLGAILIAWLASLVILFSSRFLYKVLGKNGLMACENLMGMVLIFLGVQRFMDGMKEFICNVSS